MFGHSRSSKAATAVAAILVVLAPACGTDDETAGDETTSTGDTTAQATADLGEPKRGGEVVVAASHPTPPNWTPDNAFVLEDYVLVSSVMEGLTRISADGNGIEPGLAESWELDADASTLTFTLRDNAGFSNGDPVTSADVAFSIDQWLAGPVNGFAISSITSVDTPDPQTVVMKLEFADYYLPTALALGSNGVMPADFGGRTVEEFAADPIGAGPWAIESDTPGEEVVLVPNPNYYREGIPYLDKLTWRTISDANQRLLQLQSGDVDILFPPLPLEHASELEENEVTFVDGTVDKLLLPNWQRAPMDDADFRRALSLGLDRAPIAEGVFEGRGAPSRTALPPNVPNQVEPDGDWTAFDPDEARRLLAESSYQPGTALSMLVDSAEGSDVLLAQAIQQQLDGVGITTQLEQVDTGTFFERMGTGEFDLAVHLNTTGLPSAAAWLSNISPPFGWWYTGAPVEFAQEQYNLIRAASTDEARQAVAKDVENWAFENSVWIPVVHVETPFAAASNVRMQPNPLGFFNTDEIWLDS